MKTIFIIFGFVTGFFMIGCQPKSDLTPHSADHIEQTLQLAQAQIEAQDLQAAQALLEDCLQQHPNAWEVQEALALLEVQMGYPQLAAKRFELLAESMPEEMVYRLYAAAQYKQAHQLQDAIKNQSIYLEQVPDDAQTWADLAHVYQSASQASDALDAYEQALKLNPDQTDWLKQGIRLALSLHNQRLAHLWLKQLKDQDHPPSQETVAFELQLALWEQNYSAIEQLLSAWPKQLLDGAYSEQLQPFYAWKQQQEALAQALKLKQLEQQQLAPKPPAEPIIEKTQVQQQPIDQWMDMLKKGEQLAQEGQYSDSIAIYWKALAQKPHEAPIWLKLSQVAGQAHDWGLAQAAALEAQRLNPHDLIYTLNMLKTIQMSAASDHLLPALVQAKQKFPQSIEITYDLARAYETLGRSPRYAYLAYEEYLSMAPIDHPRRAQAQLAYEQLKKNAIMPHPNL